jgi:hypothetical protein
LGIGIAVLANSLPALLISAAMAGGSMLVMQHLDEKDRKTSGEKPAAQSLVLQKRQIKSVRFRFTTAIAPGFARVEMPGCLEIKDWKKLGDVLKGNFNVAVRTSNDRIEGFNLVVRPDSPVNKATVYLNQDEKHRPGARRRINKLHKTIIRLGR